MSLPAQQRREPDEVRPKRIELDETSGEGSRSVHSASPANIRNGFVPRSPWSGVGRIAGFFAVVFAVVFALDAAVKAGLRRISTSDFGVTNRIVSGTINADIVITGSSRALVHYDPRTIQTITGRTAYNIGRNGSQTDMQIAVLRAYLQRNAKPKLIIHNLDLFSFVTSREIFDPAQYMPYLGSDPIYSAVRRVYPSAWKWKYLPLYGYLVEDMRFTWIKGLKGLVGIQPPEDHFLGYVPRNTRWTDDFEHYKRAHPDGVSFPIEPAGVREMEDLAKLCQAQGIPLLLVYSPEFSEMQAMERNRSEIFDRFQSLAKQFGATLWDFSDSGICRDRENFYNSQHLNARGSALFSAQLARRLAETDFGPRAGF